MTPFEITGHARGACLNGHLEVAKWLLDRGAGIPVANKDGMTPFQVAANKGHLQTVRLLLGYDIGVRFTTKLTERACIQLHDEICRK